MTEERKLIPAAEAAMGREPAESAPPMEGIIDRVAKAIVARRNLPCGSLINWESFKADAAIAIAAMQEPTEQMLDYGLECLHEENRMNSINEVRDMWRTMIDVALNRHG